MPRIKIDELEYNTEDLSDEGMAQFKNLQFVENQLFQLRNEIAVCQTAQLAFVSTLRSEIEKHDIPPVSLEDPSDD
jgi:hypothetical protein